MDETQGVTQTASAPLEGALPVVPSAVIVDPNIQPFVVDPSATNGQGQGEQHSSAIPNQSQGEQTQSATDERVRQIQAEKDRVYAQNLAMQQQLQTMQQQQQMFLQQFKPQQTPPDRTTDPVAYLEWKIEQGQKTLIEQSSRAQQEQFQQMLANASEMQWINQHPGVDVNAVKAFNAQNGIAAWNLDAGHRLMTMPDQVQSVRRDAINQTFNELRKSQPGASPMRGQQSLGQGQVQLSWEKMAEAYSKNPAIEESWSPELRKYFWEGTNTLSRQR